MIKIITAWRQIPKNYTGKIAYKQDILCMVNGKYHNLHGPATEAYNGYLGYYLNNGIVGESEPVNQIPKKDI